MVYVFISILRQILSRAEPGHVIPDFRILRRSRAYIVSNILLYELIKTRAWSESNSRIDALLLREHGLLDFPFFGWVNKLDLIGCQFIQR